MGLADIWPLGQPEVASVLTGPRFPQDLPVEAPLGEKVRSEQKLSVYDCGSGWGRVHLQLMLHGLVVKDWFLVNFLCKVGGV